MASKPDAETPASEAEPASVPLTTGAAALVALLGVLSGGDMSSIADLFMYSSLTTGVEALPLSAVKEGGCLSSGKGHSPLSLLSNGSSIAWRALRWLAKRVLEACCCGPDC